MSPQIFTSLLRFESKISIVGNGELSIKDKSIINNSDIVIRMNNARNYKNNDDSKTDVMVYRCGIHNVCGLNRDYTTACNTKSHDECQTILVMGFYDDKYISIAAKNTDKNVEIIKPLWSKEFGGTRDVTLSTGTTIIYYIVECIKNNLFNDKKVFLSGIHHNLKDNVHDWPLEKRIVSDIIKDNNFISKVE